MFWKIIEFMASDLEGKKTQTQQIMLAKIIHFLANNNSLSGKATKHADSADRAGKNNSLSGKIIYLLAK